MQISVDKMPVYKMSVDKMLVYNTYREKAFRCKQNVCRQSVSIHISVEKKHLDKKLKTKCL